MCAVSQISDYGQRMWPDIVPAHPAPYVYPPFPSQPSPAPFPTPTQLRDFMKLVEAAKEFDKKTGQPDCVDPQKDAWLQKVLDRLDAIEKKLDGKDV